MFRLFAMTALVTTVLAAAAVLLTGPLRTLALLILIIDGAIVVHELAHLLTARLFGIRAREFGVGFGPALLRYSAGGTVWVLRLLPIGGYVALDGEDDGPFSRLALGKRILVMAAGPLSNMVSAVVILSLMVGINTGAWGLALQGGLEIAGLILGTTVGALTSWFAHIGNPLDMPFVGLPGMVASVAMIADSAGGGAVMLAVLASALQLSVGFFNLLPIPPTDGGKIALDLIFGRSWIAPVWRDRAEGAGMAFFLLLAVGVTLIDFARIASGYFNSVVPS